MGQNHAIEGKFSPVSGAPVDGIFTSTAPLFEDRVFKKARAQVEAAGMPPHSAPGCAALECGRARAAAPRTYACTTPH